MKNLVTLLTLVFSFGFSFSQNVLISDQGNPCEPSIMFDPAKPEFVVAATVLDHYYVSSDTGHTWTEYKLHSSYGVWGDPVIGVDTAGHFYFFHLSNPPGGSWIDRIVCQKSTDQGVSWNDGSYAGLNGTKAQDKHWCAVDRNNNYIYLTWTQFDKYGSANPADSSNIFFSKSLDGGETWSDAKRINEVAGDCLDSDNTVEGAVPAVGPNGEVYVAWAGPEGIVFDRSTDQGETWLDEDIFIDPMPTGWDYSIPGIYRCNGLPVTACDISGGPNHGTIYVNWSDQRNGADDTDVWLAKSTDGGNTWQTPIRVNNDGPDKHQFLTWMAIDQTSGVLYFIFYDRRRHADNYTDVYLALSLDGGATFINKRISQSAFLPNPGVFFGDYNNIVAHNGIVRPIWTRLDNGQLSVWTDITDIMDFLVNADEQVIGTFQVQHFPNPSSDVVYFSFNLHETSAVDLQLFDTNGRAVATILHQENRGYGKHVVPVDLQALKLPAGTYYGQLLVNGKEEVMKVIVVD